MEVRWRRADLQHFEIFTHGPIIIYTRLPAGGTTIQSARSLWPVSVWHFWCLFCLLFTGICHLAHVLAVPPTKACLLCATPAGLDLYIQVHARRLLPSAVSWISEDCLLSTFSCDMQSAKVELPIMVTKLRNGKSSCLHCQTSPVSLHCHHSFSCKQQNNALVFSVLISRFVRISTGCHRFYQLS